MASQIVRVIEARQWRGQMGRTASVYGANPWTCESDRKLWALARVGWTWECSDGTVGLGRAPVATREEAQAIMDRVNARRDTLEGSVGLRHRLELQARHYELLGFWGEAATARRGEETAHMRWIRRTWGFSAMREAGRGSVAP